jgi:hypothetical protein
MGTIAKISVDLEARTAAFTAGIGRANSSLMSMGKTAIGLAGSLTGLGGFLSVGGLLAAGGKMVSLASTQIAAEKKLAATLTATGGAAGYSAAELRKFASDLQDVTNYGDEVTIDMMAVLATFREVKGDTFKEATRAIQDMSAVLGQDLQASAIQLGKALNEPIKGVTALRRVGVSFTETQLEQIKNFVETNDLASAQAVILDELKNEFGGAAEAMASTGTQMHNALGDLGEVIGGQLLPYVNLLRRDIKDMAVESQQSMGWIGTTAAYVADGFHYIGIVFDAVQTGIVDGAAYILDALAWIGQAMQDLSAYMPGEDSGGFQSFVDSVREAADSMHNSANQDWDALEKSIDEALPSERAAKMAAEIEKLRNTAAAAKPPFDELADATDKVAEKIEDLTKKYQDQADTFGMTSRQAELWKLAQQSDDPWAISQAEEAAKKLDELEKKKRDTDLGKQMTEANRTPLEEYRRQMEEIDRLLGTGAIDNETAGRAANAAWETLSDSQPAEPRAANVGAMERGSREAYSAILAAQGKGGGDPQKELKDAAKTQITHLTRIQAALEEIRDQGTTADPTTAETNFPMG